MNKGNIQPFKAAPYQSSRPSTERSMADQDTCQETLESNCWIPAHTTSTRRFTRKNITSNDKVPCITITNKKLANNLSHNPNKDGPMLVKAFHQSEAFCGFLSPTASKRGRSELLNAESYVKMSSLLENVISNEKTHAHSRSRQFVQRGICRTKSFKHQRYNTEEQEISQSYEANASKIPTYSRLKITNKTPKISEQLYSRAESSDEGTSQPATFREISSTNKYKIKLTQNQHQPKTNNSCPILEAELQLKSQELARVNQHNQRLEKTIESLRTKGKDQDKILSTMNDKISKLTTQLSKTRQENSQITMRINEKSEEMGKMLKSMEADRKQLKVVLREKEITERQLKVFVDRKVPKNIRELQTCRQISLEMTIAELKCQLNKQKTVVQKQMEQMITSLRHETGALHEQIRSLQIMNRLLEKKACDSDRAVEAYKSMKSDSKSTKLLIQEISEQCEQLRKQNIRMKKQLKRLVSAHSSNPKPKQHPLKSSNISQNASDTESLTLSLSFHEK